MFSYDQHPTISENSSINSDTNAVDRTSTNIPINNVISRNNSSKFDHDSVKFLNKKPPNISSNKIPEKICLNPIRRKSQIEKEDERNILKIGAINQVENTIKITDMIKDRDSKIFEMQTENERLNRELRSLRSQLEESENINRELVEKLYVASDSLIRCKIESENKKIIDLVNPASSETAYDRYLQDIIHSRDQLKDQNSRLREEIEKSNEQINLLNENVKYLETISNFKENSDFPVDESFIDSRSKTELLQIIRNNIEDKMIWMEYAIELTQKAVYIAPELFHINRK